MHLKCWHSMELVLGYFSFIQPRRVLTGWEQYQLTSVIWHFKMYVTFCIFSCLCCCKTISNFPRAENNSHLRYHLYKMCVLGEEKKEGKNRKRLSDQSKVSSFQESQCYKSESSTTSDCIYYFKDFLRKSIDPSWSLHRALNMTKYLFLHFCN